MRPSRKRLGVVAAVVVLLAGALALSAALGGGDDDPPRRGAAAPEDPPPPPPPAADATFRGDFATGDLSQWEVAQTVSDDRIQVVPAPGRRKGVAARFTVTPADSIGGTDPRAELAADLDEPEGSERWYRWSTFVPEDFPTTFPDAFVTFTQWRAKDESDSYGNFMIWGDELQLRLEGVHWRAPLVKGRWHDFVYHVRWSGSPQVGFIELWFDGDHVLPRKPMATMRPGVRNYIKQGLYKSREIPSATIFHAGLTVSTR
jgi:hypothetical protein